jgi:cell division protein FtsW
LKLTRHRPDFIILIAVLLLVSVGLLTIYSASFIWAYQEMEMSPHFFFFKQCMFTLLGLGAMIFTMNLPFWIWRKLLLILLPLTLFLLLAVFAFPTVSADGSAYYRWIRIGPISFQPSELATLTIIFYMAHILTKKQDRLDDFKKTVIPPMAVALLFSLLVILEPDMDAAALIFGTALAILFGGGVPLMHIARIVLPVAGLGAIYIMKSEYHRVRFTGFLNPFDEKYFHDIGYQQANSLYAIASGGWQGKGLGRSIEKFLYLPEPHTDFIFAIFLEEWGTIFGIFLIVVFGILIWRAIRIVSLLPDRFGSLLVIGITSMIGIAVVVNIGMVSGALPVMGIPLPFISYGGTAVVLKMAAMGILLNLSRYTVEDQTMARR